MKIHQVVQLGEKLSLKYLLIILCLFNFMFSQCQGDMNGDGVMNVIDLVASVNLILSGTFECESIIYSNYSSQNQDNCCEGPNGEANWSTCP